MRSVLRSKPHLRKCLSKCRHCQIYFLTHPRNAGRNDLGCPFGCRQTHQKKAAIKRSIEYYRSDAGKIKKKQLNDRRADQNRLVESKQGEMRLRICQSDIDKTMLSHIEVVTALIEARDVGWDEIVRMVAEILRHLRQLSIDKRKKGVYPGCDQPKNPP
ncbi:MAG: hypothetical protein ACE5HX_06875 [bacterium]